MSASLLALPHGDLPLPAFLPDATRGVVRAVDSADLEGAGVTALVMNTYHLMQRPGSSTIKALGGLHRMAAWSRPIMTDSGGFQVYSLIRQNPKYGRLSDRGAVFTPDGGARKITLTPEKSIQLQMSYGADILICLDDCTHADDPLDEQRRSVRRTVAWARRAKAEYLRLVEQKKLAESERPLLFAVIQGGGSADLRRECADELLSIGFDGYGYGGWPLDADGSLLTDMLALTRELVPPQFPVHALGVGHPANVVACARLGYALFDSAMPTRDARHGRLYTLSSSRAIPGRGQDWFAFRYINDEKYIRSQEPVSPGCDCPACQHYSLAYLSHLYRMQDSAYFRLATQHNLRFMTRLMEQLRDEPLLP